MSDTESQAPLLAGHEIMIRKNSSLGNEFVVVYQR